MSALKAQVVLISIIVFLIAIFLISKAFERNDQAAIINHLVLVESNVIKKQDFPFNLELVANVIPNQSIAINSRIDSVVTEVKFKDGDYVNQNDLLFVLDDRILNAQLDQAKANLEQDQIHLADAKKKYERNIEIAKKGYLSIAELDDSKTAFEIAKATLEAEQAAIENLEIQLSYTKILAPISGRTGTINSTVGNTVKANDDIAMVTINEVKPILVQVAIPERYITKVRTAMKSGKVKVIAKYEQESDHSERISQGNLEYINNTIDNSTATFITRAKFKNENEELWPGMFVNLIITLEIEKGVLTVPEVAIQHGQSGDFVFVVEKNKAMKKNIKVSRIQDGIAVISGEVKAQDIVITDGFLSLKNGSPISIKVNKEPNTTP